jgi:hypothetical protein
MSVADLKVGTTPVVYKFEGLYVGWRKAARRAGEELHVGLAFRPAVSKV